MGFATNCLGGTREKQALKRSENSMTGLLSVLLDPQQLVPAQTPQILVKSLPDTSAAQPGICPCPPEAALAALLAELFILFFFLTVSKAIWAGGRKKSLFCPHSDWFLFLFVCLVGFGVHLAIVRGHSWLSAWGIMCYRGQNFGLLHAKHELYSLPSHLSGLSDIVFTWGLGILFWPGHLPLVLSCSSALKNGPKTKNKNQT